MVELQLGQVCVSYPGAAVILSPDPHGFLLPQGDPVLPWAAVPSQRPLRPSPSSLVRAAILQVCEKSYFLCPSRVFL